MPGLSHGPQRLATIQRLHESPDIASYARGMALGQAVCEQANAEAH